MKKTWEGVIAAIDKVLAPKPKTLKKQVTEDDIVSASEIRIKKKSLRFDLETKRNNYLDS